MKRVWIIFSLVMLVSCASVDVYFPKAAVQTVADSIIQDVWQPLHTRSDLKDAK
jgi:hypothetical protein